MKASDLIVRAAAAGVHLIDVAIDDGDNDGIFRYEIRRSSAAV